MTLLREMQKACDLYALGRASVHQVARAAWGDVVAASAEVERLSRLLAARDRQVHILKSRIGRLQSRAHRISAAMERRDLKCSEVLTAEKVHAAVEQVTGVQAGSLFGKGRNGELSRARWLGWLAFKRLCPEMSLTETARLFARDHSTILHAHRDGAERLQTDPDFAEDFRSIVELLADPPTSEAAE